MNWITKIIKAGEKIKTAFHERATKEDIAKSDWTSCCRGPILKKDLEQNFGFVQIVISITELNQVKDLIFYLVKIIMKYLRPQFQKMIH
jgi:hypothetical protein